MLTLREVYAKTEIVLSVYYVEYRFNECPRYYKLQEVHDNDKAKSLIERCMFGLKGNLLEAHVKLRPNNIVEIFLPEGTLDPEIRALYKGMYTELKPNDSTSIHLSLVYSPNSFEEYADAISGFANLLCLRKGNPFWRIAMTSLGFNPAYLCQPRCINKNKH